MFLEDTNIPRHGMGAVVVAAEHCEGGIKADERSVGKWGESLLEQSVDRPVGLPLVAKPRKPIRATCPKGSGCIGTLLQTSEIHEIFQPTPCSESADATADLSSHHRNAQTLGDSNHEWV